MTFPCIRSLVFRIMWTCLFSKPCTTPEALDSLLETGMDV